MKLIAAALASLSLFIPSATANLRLVANAPQGGTTNSDLAFWGKLAFQGSFDGFRIVDVSNPELPVEVADVQCRGPQGDISVWQNLVFVSIDRPQTGPTCESQDTREPTEPTAFEGIRIFDVSDPAAPRFVKGVSTDCGSHTHTILPDVARARVLIYVSSYAIGAGPRCGPGRGPDALHRKISIVEVPLAAPEDARVAATPRVDADLFRAGRFRTIGCHDISFFMPGRLAAASCMSEGQLWDVSSPLRPRILARIRNRAFNFWHSATFTWDGRFVIFGDESFPGSCNQPRRDLSGRLWIYRTAAPQEPLASFTIPRRQPESVCSAHMFNLVPVKGRYLLVSSWYEGGADVIEMTDPSRPREIASFDPEGNHWAAYWYDGLVYASDFNRGLDVLREDALPVGNPRTLGHLNPQTQEIRVR